MNFLLEATETYDASIPTGPIWSSYSARDGVQAVPLTMPAEQEYFWHYEWRQGERESLAELRAGGAVVFDSDDPEDIARWLDETDDDD